MASHWETLGFPCQSTEDIETIMRQAYHLMQTYPEHKTHYPGELYNYDCVSIGGGAIEVWMQQNKEDGFYIMAHPHLRGRSAIPVRLREAIDAGLGDIAFLVDVNPKNGEKELTPIYPIDGKPPNIPNCSFQALIAPPYAQHVIQRVNQDDMAMVQITAFAEKIEVFNDEKAYIASQTPIDMGQQARGLMGGLLAFKNKMNKPVYMGSQYFMATDLVNDTEGTPTPRAWMAAIVESVTCGENPLTHQPIYVVLAKTVDDIPIDITIAGSQIDGLEPGNIITGTFWLSARFIFEEEDNPTSRKIDTLELETYFSQDAECIRTDVPLVRILINGIDLIDLVKPIEAKYEPEVAGAYDGPYAQDVFWPSKRLLNDPEFWFEGEGRVDLLQCNCGVSGCWELTCKITETEDFIVWSDFQNNHRENWDYSALGTFCFSKEQYLKALQYKAV